MITDIVTALKSATSLSVYPFYVDGLKECIVYEWTPLSDDGSKEVAQLMIRIKTKTMANAETYAGQVKNCLISIGDVTKNKAYCKQNGGGTLKDADTGYIDYIMYFDLVFRSQVQ